MATEASPIEDDGGDGGRRRGRDHSDWSRTLMRRRSGPVWFSRPLGARSRHGVADTLVGVEVVQVIRTRASRARRRVRRSRSAPTTACTSATGRSSTEVRKLAAEPGLAVGRGHLRPAPGQRRPPRVGPAAAHRPRPEARAAGGDRRRLHARRPLRRGAVARSRPRTSSARCWSSCLDASGRGGRGLPLRPPAPGQRRACCARWVPSPASRSRARPGRRSTAAQADEARQVSSTAIRRPLAAGELERAANRCSAATTRSGAVVEHGDQPRAASSASRPPTWPCPATSCCPPTASTPAGTTRPDGPAPRGRSRSAAADVLRDRPTPRCSRPTCSTSTATSTASGPGSVRRAAPGRGEVRLGRGAGRADAPRLRRRPQRVGRMSLPALRRWRPSTGPIGAERPRPPRPSRSIGPERHPEPARPPVDAPPAGRPGWPAHTSILDDGHQVGVAVSGRGVPLVVVHGFSAEGFLYAQTLSRLVGMGFKVVAIDTAGHGGTQGLPGRRRQPVGLRHAARPGPRRARASEQAVLAGHSMGGRL